MRVHSANPGQTLFGISGPKGGIEKRIDTAKMVYFLLRQIYLAQLFVRNQQIRVIDAGQIKGFFPER